MRIQGSTKKYIFNFTSVILFISQAIYVSNIPVLSIQITFTLLVTIYIVLNFFKHPSKVINSIASEPAELFILIGIYLIYVKFANRSTVHSNIQPLYLCALYGLPSILYCIALMIYCGKSCDNFVRLMNAFLGVVILSFSIYALGLIYPDQLFAFRYFVYGSSYDELLLSNSVGSSELFWTAGLSPYLYLFGYQVSAGSALILVLLLTTPRNHGFWLLIFLLSMLNVVCVAQRSNVPALTAAMLTFIIVEKQTTNNIQRFIKKYGRILFLFSCIGLMVFVGRLIMDGYYYEKNVSIMQDRLNSDDVRVRLGMQLAALKIIMNNPFGVSSLDLEEERWGLLAEKLGYNVVSDSNQIDYALVHNGFLRIILYEGWFVGLIILFILLYLGKKGLSIIRILGSSLNIDKELKRYSLASLCVFISIFVQSNFHNDSFFTLERNSIITLMIFLTSTKVIKKQSTFYE